MQDELASLFRQVASGAVTLSHALAQARAIPAHADFDDDGIHPLARGAIAAAQAGNGQRACLLWRIVLEALDHPRTPAQHEAVRSAASAWINIVSFSLAEFPDGRILSDARRRGEDLANALLAEGNRPGAGLVYFQLGAMLLDPYIERRDPDPDVFPAQVEIWLMRARAPALDLLLPGETEMPSASEALRAATAYLENAAGLREGRERGKSLKALIEARFWLGVATGRYDLPAIASVRTEALQLLDPARDSVAIEQLAQYASLVGLEPTEGAEIDVSDERLEAMAREDPRGVIHVLALRGERAASPEESIRYLLRALVFAKQVSDDEARVQLTTRIGVLALRKHGCSWLLGRDGPLRRIRRGIARLVGLGGPAADRWTQAEATLKSRLNTGEAGTLGELATALLGIAIATSNHDREDVGLDLVARAMGEDVSGIPGIDVALETARVELSWRLGATHFKAKRWEKACAHYLDTARAAIAAEMLSVARENYTRAMDAFGLSEHPGNAAVVESAGEALPRLQAEHPDLTFHIARSWRRVIRDLAFVSRNDDLLVSAIQAAKGATLALARQGDKRREVLRSSSVERALEHWRAAHAALGPESASPTDVDEELLLAAFDDSRSIPGSTPAERVDNLARRFDQVLTSELARGVDFDDRLILTGDEIRACLPEGTVLLSVYPCPTAEGELGIVALLATREEVCIRLAASHEPVVEMATDGIWVDTLAPVVYGLRTALLDPDPGEVRSEVLDRLEGLYEYAIAAVHDDLATLQRRGYHHLCINPHGALHFCPFALLGRDGTHLADDWVVTYLPAIGLLRPRAAAARPDSRTGASVFGLGFSDGPDAIPAAPREARRVADAIGGRLFLDSRATACRFDEALVASQFVHVATHGHQDAISPAFQTLYLAPDDSHDGKYHAFEVLRHQLDGLELVTLSACETALGRIDHNDNLRGLQAFLHMAGAPTVVSTLWPVVDDVAALFFERLYAELAAGRSKLESFVTAQRGVREQFPEMTDWGAFTYSGHW